MTKYTTAAVVSVFAMASAAGQCSSSTSASAGSDHWNAQAASYAQPTMNLVETAVSAGSFDTLVAAVKAADLVGALSGDGPLTVFAPTDEAFANLPEGTVDTLLEPENKELLQAILLYHVVAGDVRAETVVGRDAAETLNGQRVSIEVDGGAVKLDDANVVQTDILTTNGTIHVIDRVIMPSTSDIIETAVEAGSFTTLAAAIEAAGLIETLQGDGPFTVFAPTDEAFSNLPAGTVESLLEPENKDKLISILTYHVVPGRVYADQALEAGKAKTVEGCKVTISVVDGQAMVNGASIVTTDIDATNGVIHVIDDVLMP